MTEVPKLFGDIGAWNQNRGHREPLTRNVGVVGQTGADLDALDAVDASFFAGMHREFRRAMQTPPRFARDPRRT